MRTKFQSENKKEINCLGDIGVYRRLVGWGVCETPGNVATNRKNTEGYLLKAKSFKPIFNIQSFYVLPTQCVYVFCVDLRTNSDYFPIQH
jgi:hypothetical protein